MKVLDYLRYVGAVLLIGTFPLAAVGWTWIALGFLLAVGIIDIVLVVAKVHTISQWIHRLFPKAIDAFIVVLLMIFTWFVWGPMIFLPVFLGVVIGHLFWND